MSRIELILSMEDTFTFGMFMGMTVKEAIDKNPRRILRMKNNGYFVLEASAIDYLKESLI